MTPARRRLTVATALSSLVGAVVLAGTQTAQAEVARERDAVRDVRHFAMSDDGQMRPSRDPNQSNGDIRSYRVMYLRHTIKVEESFRELDHSDPRLLVGGAIKMAGGETREVIVRAHAGDWRGTARLQSAPRCEVRHRLDYADNKAMILVPASCLDDPAWIRFQAAAVTADSLRHPTYFNADMAPGQGLAGTQYGDRVEPGRS